MQALHSTHLYITFLLHAVGGYTRYTPTVQAAEH